MSSSEATGEHPVAAPTNTGLRWRLAGLVAVSVALLCVAIAWLLDGSIVGHWMAVHTGLDDLSGSWYGFWSGFGSDLAEFGLIGAVATGVYQIVRKYNCHEPGCWRVGTHPAANGQFLLCYRHHPDFRGQKPTHETIERLHREHLARTAAFHEKIEDMHARLGPGPAAVAGRDSVRTGGGAETGRQDDADSAI
jgi:hypothetical protein